jgi:alkanesulfonate monooxygenase SsuD/methylene tetrahydromethanopterin reductase-like flavin-dependent oxidoreductase (luciferase family)
LLPALREPLLLTKQVAALSILSHGRLSLGVGLGGEYEPEWRAVGVPISERAKRTDAFLSAWAGFLSQASLSEEDPRPMPDNDRLPTIWIGGRSTASYDRAVRFNAGWLGMWKSPTDVQAVTRELASRAGASAEPPRAGLVVFLNVGPEEQARAEAEAYVEACFGLPAGKVARWLVTGSVEQVARSLSDYVLAGVSLFVLHPASPRPLEQYELIQQSVARATTLASEASQ